MFRLRRRPASAHRAGWSRCPRRQCPAPPASYWRRLGCHAGLLPLAQTLPCYVFRDLLRSCSKTAATERCLKSRGETVDLSAARPAPRLELHCERAYWPRDVATWLMDAGLVLCDVLDAATFRKATACHRRIIVVAQKSAAGTAAPENPVHKHGPSPTHCVYLGYLVESCQGER